MKRVNTFFISIFVILLHPPLLLPSSSALGAPYYIDSSRPNDSGDGTYAGRAKKTISAALTLLNDGDTLSLAKGSEWFESVSLNRNNLTINSYGAGQLRIYD
jgi:hypothetical protein